jgi:diaminopropionate ammonia-lyase
LLSLSGLAREVGVESIHYKDESQRFGLKSFKALGGAYAVYRLLADEVKARTGIDHVSAEDLLSGGHKDVLSDITVTSATDGNHGRSVAWGAHMFGCGCVIYIHEQVSRFREEAIAAYGARVVRFGSNYEESVRRCAADAERYGRHIVSDTSYEGYRRVPRIVMQGYTLMTEEAMDEMERVPTHVFVQGGVGGLAASVCSYLWESLGDKRPHLVVVEPDKADCLFQSAGAGVPVTLDGDYDTFMAGLSCGEISVLAWEILGPGADFFLTVPDESAMATMRLLADAPFGDAPVVGGEAGVAGLAGFLAAVQDERAREALELRGPARILVFGTEGATDPGLYHQTVGRFAEEVLARD